MPYLIALSSRRSSIALNPKLIAFISVIFVLIVLFDCIIQSHFSGPMLVQASAFGSWLHRLSHVFYFLCFYFLASCLFCDLVYLINLIWFEPLLQSLLYGSLYDAMRASSCVPTAQIVHILCCCWQQWLYYAVSDVMFFFAFVIIYDSTCYQSYCDCRPLHTLLTTEVWESSYHHMNGSNMQLIQQTTNLIKWINVHRVS